MQRRLPPRRSQVQTFCKTRLGFGSGSKSSGWTCTLSEGTATARRGFWFHDHPPCQGCIMVSTLQALLLLLGFTLPGMSRVSLGVATKRASTPVQPCAVLQFRALSFALYGTEDYYRQIREKAVKHMRWVAPVLPVCLQQGLLKAWSYLLLVVGNGVMQCAAIMRPALCYAGHD